MPIVVTGLTKKYGDRTVVEDLDMVVEPGRFTGFLGLNGAGKSTTMRMMSNIDRATAGNVSFDGELFANPTSSVLIVGSMLDVNALDPDRSARSSLKYMAAAAGLASSRVDEVLEPSGIAIAAKRRVGLRRGRQLMRSPAARSMI
ncbi:MAG: ABC-2 type transport system ATP-binding protein [Candidatus Aldehydirespiratoraceae bacterium]|jgi:ABC-2 type transport system ATP-binding protein